MRICTGNLDFLVSRPFKDNVIFPALCPFRQGQHLPRLKGNDVLKILRHFQLVLKEIGEFIQKLFLSRHLSRNLKSFPVSFIIDCLVPLSGEHGQFSSVQRPDTEENLVFVAFRIDSDVQGRVSLYGLKRGTAFKKVGVDFNVL